jgi:hypothetical protein
MSHAIAAIIRYSFAASAATAIARGSSSRYDHRGADLGDDAIDHGILAFDDSGDVALELPRPDDPSRFSRLRARRNSTTCAPDARYAPEST